MKKILLFIVFITLAGSLLAQTGVGWGNQKSKVNFKDSINIASGWKLKGVIILPSGAEINYVDGVTSAIQTQINLKAPLANPTFTGTVTIPSPFTLGATSVTTTGAQLNFSNTVTSNIQTQLNNTVPGSTLYVAKGDSANGGGATGSYVSGKDYKTDKATFVPYTGATTDLTLGAHNFTSTGQISSTASIAADGIISIVNSNATDLSKGIYARQHAESGNGTYYGGYFMSNGSNTGTNIGVYALAADASSMNWAGYFAGNLATTGRLVVGGDTCKGTQTKTVTNLSWLKVTDACILNGLNGGAEGQVLYIVNSTATTLVLKHNGSGTQKFAITGAGDLTLAGQYNSVTCMYIGGLWYIVGKGQ